MKIKEKKNHDGRSTNTIPTPCFWALTQVSIDISFAHPTVE